MHFIYSSITKKCIHIKFDLIMVFILLIYQVHYYIISIKLFIKFFIVFIMFNLPIRSGSTLLGVGLYSANASRVCLYHVRFALLD